MMELIKTGVRVFRPQEYESLLAKMSIEQQIQLNGLLVSGMRYVEAQRLQEHPEWLEGKFIHLPKGSTLKEKAHFDNRVIRLSNAGMLTMPNFVNGAKLPTSLEGWRKNLKRWTIKAGLSDKAISVKSTRKTWESWLMLNYPNKTPYITLSQGHTGKTSEEYYLVDGFTDSDHKESQKWTDGWF